MEMISNTITVYHHLQLGLNLLKGMISTIIIIKRAT